MISIGVLPEVPVVLFLLLSELQEAMNQEVPVEVTNPEVLEDMNPEAVVMSLEVEAAISSLEVVVTSRRDANTNPERPERLVSLNVIWTGDLHELVDHYLLQKTPSVREAISLEALSANVANRKDDHMERGETPRGVSGTVDPN